MMSHVDETRCANGYIRRSVAGLTVDRALSGGVLEWLNVTRGVEIRHDGDLPARSGLGASSAFTVGLIKAMHAPGGQSTSNETIADDAIQIEQVRLREPVGAQDQISAAFGGFNHITFHIDGRYDVRPVALPRARLDDLQRHLMLVFTGIPRTSNVAQTIVDNLERRTSEMRTMQQMVHEAMTILCTNTDLTELGRLIDESWRRSTPTSPTRRIST